MSTWVMVGMVLWLALLVGWDSTASISENITSEPEVAGVTATSSPLPTPTPTPLPLAPTTHIIPGRVHAFQTFNNCGPASLSMALSYFDISISQRELGDQLRPHQQAQGINDDKSVTLAELAKRARQEGLFTYLRPNASPTVIKAILAQDLPVVIRTLLTPDDDIGHYRLLRGYDDVAQQYTQDDSLQGANLTYDYDNFDSLWKPFNYEYLVIVDADRRAVVEQILGEDLDERVAWEKAKAKLEQELAANPSDHWTQFNLSVANFRLGDYQAAIAAFEQVERRLPNRTLWYQIEPILAYFKVGNYERVLSLTEEIFRQHNVAFSELYDLRGQIFQIRGDPAAAAREFALARQYNHGYQLGSLE